MKFVPERAAFLQKAVSDALLKKFKLEKNAVRVIQVFDETLNDVLEDGIIDDDEINMLSEKIAERIDIEFLRPKKCVLIILIGLNVCSVLLIPLVTILIAKLVELLQQNELCIKMTTDAAPAVE
jgi:hypothetical protein